MATLATTAVARSRVVLGRAVKGGGDAHASEDARVALACSSSYFEALFPEARQHCDLCEQDASAAYGKEDYFTAPLPCAHTLCHRCYGSKIGDTKSMCPIVDCSCTYTRRHCVVNSSRAQLLFEKESKERLALCKTYFKTLEDFEAEEKNASSKSASPAAGHRARHRFAAYLDRREQMVRTLVHGSKSEAEDLRQSIRAHVKKHNTAIEARWSALSSGQESALQWYATSKTAGIPRAQPMQ